MKIIDLLYSYEKRLKLVFSEPLKPCSSIHIPKVYKEILSITNGFEIELTQTYFFSYEEYIQKNKNQSYINNKPVYIIGVLNFGDVIGMYDTGELIQVDHEENVFLIWNDIYHYFFDEYEYRIHD